MPVSNHMSNLPDDVLLLRSALCSDALTIDLANCGTAMRFLTAYFAQLPGRDVVLTGCERMLHRPIGQLVEALRSLGADITYLGEEGFPPLRVRGRDICARANNKVSIQDPQSTQFVSALLLIGVEVETNISSPYIDLTQSMVVHYAPGQGIMTVEPDWSAAAFWYEYVALHGGSLTLSGLRPDSLQGDRVVADIFAKLGVATEYDGRGALISRTSQQTLVSELDCDFAACQDLYPAVAITCKKLNIKLIAAGTESLRWKESDRLDAVNNLLTEHDHRMAMALMAADYPCDDRDCVRKSYPDFVRQLQAVQGVERLSERVTRITPRRGLNDEGRGKKFALGKLIRQADTEYVWLTDDDISVAIGEAHLSALHMLADDGADMVILPLRMSAGDGSLLCRLQQAEYAAIQQLTIETARRGHAVMCSGANLLVRRERWLEVESELHPEIASGDDMFLLEAFKRRGWRVETISAEADGNDHWRVLEVSIDPRSTLDGLSKQHARWAGKAAFYTDRDIIACGALVLLANLIQLICPLIMLIKFPIEYTLIRRRDPSITLALALLLEVVYPFQMVLCLVQGLFRRSASSHPSY